MIHLTPADYVQQPWKNGLGTTTELWRHEAEGRLLVRLSRAAVVEDGPFSLFPGIDRNLTVLSGPGFRLTGDGVSFRCDPMVPVAFPGDLALAASETMGRPSDDFNVMTARGLVRAEVQLAANRHLKAGGLLALFALGPCLVNARTIAANDLVLTDGPVTVAGDGPVIAARFPGL